MKSRVKSCTEPGGTHFNTTSWINTPLRKGVIHDNNCKNPAPPPPPTLISYLCHGPGSWQILEWAEREACWFQLAVCCFTLWAMELVIPRMERVWGAELRCSHRAISLYDSFIPTKRWLPHSPATVLAPRAAAEVHLLRTVSDTCGTKYKMSRLEGWCRAASEGFKWLWWIWQWKSSVLEKDIITISVQS